MLLFFDIDGTIWDYKNYIPESAKKAIRLARQNGHRCFLNSGRARAFIQNKELLDIGFDGIVSACGSMIEYQGKVIYNKLLSPEEGIRTMESTRRYGFKSILEGPKYCYMEREEFYGDMFGEKVMAEMGEYLLGIDDNWGKWEINKLSSATAGCDSAGCFAEIDDIFDFVVHNDEVVEMVPKGHNKGTGIKTICELLGEDIRDTFAFGDSINDMDMLKAAGVSIAMGRAVDEAKEIASFVTDNLEDDGIWNAMKKYDLI